MAIQEIKVPDLEGAQDVGVVEVYVQAGDAVEIEDPVISLESDKAVMDMPSPVKGRITEIKISAGDTVNTGDVVALAEISGDASESEAHPPGETIQSYGTQPRPRKQPDVSLPQPEKQPDAAAAKTEMPQSAREVGSSTPNQSTGHATPSVRALARELGVNLDSVSGSGPKGRITRDDVSALVKSVMSGASASLEPSAWSSNFAMPPIPSVNYADYGEVETVQLSRIQKISGPHLHRNWVGVPHVTQFDEADITALEEFRRTLNEEYRKKEQTKISPLIFVIKAVVQALKTFQDFNSSLNPDAASLTLKKYYNIGIAVDTPGGLVVPVIRNADSKGIRTLAGELADISSRAREGKLKQDEMKGGSFTISSLGGIGGTNFTPIVNAPEVAILGLSRSTYKPVWDGKEFVPRLMLPLSVSYDHRVIDGAQGARFTRHLAVLIGDIRRILL